ncbi:MAG TPA: YdiU family protein [Gammaproteobacteria bacterium]|nr:YdiU family protein [Gammaproteobacteria bacterium]
MKTLEALSFDNRYARLPDIFYTRHQPMPLQGQFLIHFNQDVAHRLGLDPSEAERDDFVDIVTGAKPLPGYEPLAMCYSGHQFGHYVPRLGDGRALLLGQITTESGEYWDWHLKGGGLTAYSRDGDGRAVLRSSIREYLCSAAMQGLGIATTQALCLTGSEEEVYRENIETGAMILRVAPSHIRFGSFEFLYYTERFDALKILADYVIEYHYPQLREQPQPYLGLLREVVQVTATMIAQWQAVGFAHGVMNTDNLSVLGLTMDYGPFGFLDTYQPGFICNHSDHSGRYAFDRQPEIALFNLSCFAQTLLPLLEGTPEAAGEQAMAVLKSFQPQYQSCYDALMRSKLGLATSRAEDGALVDELLALMAKNQVDYTILFRALGQAGITQRNTSARDLFLDREACDLWLEKYQARLDHEAGDSVERCARMNAINPKRVLRNYLAEVAIRRAEDDQDYREIDQLMRALKNPYTDMPEFEHYADHPPAWATQVEVSCSS